MFKGPDGIKRPDLIVYDDHWCKVEIVEGAISGCYHIIVDDDPENGTCAIGEKEALDEAEWRRECFIEENGQFGVGA